MAALAPRLVRAELVLLALAGALTLGTPAAHASDISFVDTFGNLIYEQTGNGNTLSFNGAFASAGLYSTVSNAYTSASFTPPGGVATPLLQATAGDYEHESGLYPTLAAMEGVYGPGTYHFSGIGSTTDTATLTYTTDDYAKTVPYLTGTTYSSLQGMNASQGFTFSLSPFTPGGAAAETNAYIFFSIFDQTSNTTAYSDSFLPSTTTSIFLPGGTLTAGHSYSFDLDYSDRDTVSGTGANFPPLAGFEVRTDGTFSTAALVPTPEPGSLILLGTGIAGIAGAVRRRLA